jgi:YidC/Oxa1 family membrane protein insertase
VLGPIYWGISWILLQWHSLWHLAFGGGSWLRTNWDWVLAIVFLVLTVRGVLFPVFVKQIKAQRAMQAIAPQIKALQEKHKGDRETLQKEMMELYRREKANPLMGCLPMVIQIPVMWSLFHVLRHLKPTMPDHLKSLYGWTIGQFDSASSAKLFGAPIAASFRSSATDLTAMHANGTTVKIVAGVLVAIMIATMILKTGWSEDPQQKMIQRLMLYGIPVSLLISGGIFPIGVVIYWTTTNLFSLGQQFWVLRKYPPPPSATKAAGTAGKSTAKGKGAPVKAVPSAAAKALAPKPGAKPVKKAATPAKATKVTGTKVTGTKVTGAKAAPGKATSARQAAPPNGSEPANGTEPVDGGVAAPKPGARPVAAKKAPAKRTGPAKQTGAAKQGDAANRPG